MPTRPPVHNARAAQANRKAHDNWRGTSAERGYDAAWRKVRITHLQAEPLCRFCRTRGELTAATMVDHIQTIVERPDLRLVDANLRSLCKPCHDAHTASQVARGHVGMTKARRAL